jgi:hypothetical protein
MMKDMKTIKTYEYMTSPKSIIATRLPGLVKKSEWTFGVQHNDRPEGVLKPPEDLKESNTIQGEGKGRGSVQSSGYGTLWQATPRRS